MFGAVLRFLVVPAIKLEMFQDVAIRPHEVDTVVPRALASASASTEVLTDLRWKAPVASEDGSLILLSRFGGLRGGYARHEGIQPQLFCATKRILPRLAFRQLLRRTGARASA
jgi:hypothetical protein